MESSCEGGNETSDLIKCWETTEWLHNLWPLKQYSAPQSQLVIRRRLNSGNACYHWAQNLPSSRLPSKNVKIRIYKTSSVVLYGCETWSLKLREEHKMCVFENRALRRIFGPKRDEVMGDWRKLHN
jgi:hypothetical protein